jgi:hypothetical protein
LKLRWPIFRWTVVGNIALSLVTTWVSVCWSRDAPNLSYTVAEMRPIVFDEGFTPAITVEHDTRKISSNVWAMTVFVWNRGRVPIEPPFRRAPRLSTEPPVQILSTTILRESHPLCRFRINKAPEPGVLDLTWDILEKNDGAAIEILYTGSRTTNVHIHGAWTGQRVLSRDPFMRRNNFTIGVLVLMFFMTAAVTLMAAIEKKRGAHLLAAVFWILMTGLTVRAVLFGIPRSIDVGPDISNKAGFISP